MDVFMPFRRPWRPIIRAGPSLYKVSKGSAAWNRRCAFGRSAGHCARFSCERPVSCGILAGIPAGFLAWFLGALRYNQFVCLDATFGFYNLFDSFSHIVWMDFWSPLRSGTSPAGTLRTRSWSWEAQERKNKLMFSRVGDKFGFHPGPGALFRIVATQKLYHFCLPCFERRHQRG